MRKKEMGKREEEGWGGYITKCTHDSLSEVVFESDHSLV
jgi:hypothetical protein